MKKIIYLFAVLAIFASASTSCTKYEEGGTYSLLTKKMRITNKWYISKTQTGSLSLEFNEGDVYYEFQKDGTYIEHLGSVAATGTWEFNDDKSELSTTINNTSTATIFLLKNDQLGLESGGVKVYYSPASN